MNQINPIKKAWYNADRAQRSMDLRKSYIEKNNKRRDNFEADVFLWQRYLGDIKTPLIRVMSGRDGNAENDNEMRIFIKKCDSNKANRRLVKWKCLRKATEQEIAKESPCEVKWIG